MFGGRLYTVKFQNVAVAAVQDLAGYLCAAGKFAFCEGFWVDDVDQALPAACSLNLAILVLTSTVSPGAGGTTTAPAKWDQGDSNPSGSAWQNATAPATTSGTIFNPFPAGCHLYQGRDRTFKQPLPLLGGEAVVLNLGTAPAASSKLSGGLFIREFGG